MNFHSQKKHQYMSDIHIKWLSWHVLQHVTAPHSTKMAFSLESFLISGLFFLYSANLSFTDLSLPSLNCPQILTSYLANCRPVDLLMSRLQRNCCSPDSPGREDDPGEEYLRPTWRGSAGRMSGRPARRWSALELFQAPKLAFGPESLALLGPKFYFHFQLPMFW